VVSLHHHFNHRSCAIIFAELSSFEVMIANHQSLLNTITFWPENTDLQLKIISLNCVSLKTLIFERFIILSKISLDG
jgi:hypothetical protein